MTVLAPGVAVNDGEGKDLFAAVRREEGIKGLRGLDFAMFFGLGLLLGGLFSGLFGGNFGSGERMRGRRGFGEVGCEVRGRFERGCGGFGEIIMRGVFGEMSGPLQGFKLTVVVEAGTVDGGFELVEGVEVFIILRGGGFGMNVFEELFAELGEADRGAVVGLALFVEAHESAEIFGADLLPVLLVVAAGDSEDLDGTAVFRNEGKNAVNVEVGIVEGSGDVAEEGFEFGVADFVFLEEIEEGLLLLGGDFDEVRSDEDLGVVTAGEVGDDLGLLLLGDDDGVVGEAGGGDRIRGRWGGGRRGGDVLEFVEIFGKRGRKFV